MPVIVAIPTTLRSSNSVCPSTSKFPFALMLPVVSNCPKTVAPIPDVEKRCVLS